MSNFNAPKSCIPPDLFNSRIKFLLKNKILLMKHVKKIRAIVSHLKYSSEGETVIFDPLVAFTVELTTA